MPYKEIEGSEVNLVFRGVLFGRSEDGSEEKLAKSIGNCPISIGGYCPTCNGRLSDCFGLRILKDRVTVVRGVL